MEAQGASVREGRSSMLRCELLVPAGLLASLPRESTVGVPKISITPITAPTELLLALGKPLW
jgi:hypothetical protein